MHFVREGLRLEKHPAQWMVAMHFLEQVTELCLAGSKHILYEVFFNMNQLSVSFCSKVMGRFSPYIYRYRYAHHNMVNAHVRTASCLSSYVKCLY